MDLPLIPWARRQAGRPSVVLHTASIAQCCIRVMAVLSHAYRLRALCLPRCFRILHGVISAVLNSLKKRQLFHLASSTQAKPSSFSKLRAMGLDLLESLAWGSPGECWARLPSAQPKPHPLRGTTLSRWSFFEKGGARPAPQPLETLAPPSLLTSAAQLPSVPLSKAYPSLPRR